MNLVSPAIINVPREVNLMTPHHLLSHSGNARAYSKTDEVRLGMYLEPKIGIGYSDDNSINVMLRWKETPLHATCPRK